MWALTFRRYFTLLAARLRGRTVSHVLKSVWNSDKVRADSLAGACRFLVVDTETSSLNPSDGDLLSVGWVEIVAGEIQLETAQHFLIKNKNSVGQSATIHHLRDCELEEGLTKQEVMVKLLTAAQNAMLVFHHAPLDLAYLNNLCCSLYGAPLCLPVADTLAIEKKKLERREMSLGNGALRLANCRFRYHLPDYPAHNALMDALATAELLLAQLAYMGKGVRVRDLV